MYKIGDVVSVNNDRGEVAKMQKGHEYWVEDMIEIYACINCNVHACNIGLIIINDHIEQ